jgi:hypothetical protein
MINRDEAGLTNGLSLSSSYAKMGAPFILGRVHSEGAQNVDMRRKQAVAVGDERVKHT